MLKVELTFLGADASKAEIDFYDVAQALIGFQRSLALTTHVILNGEVITQAPSLKGATILALPPEEGSWKIVAGIVGTVFAAGQASHDSVVGHMLYSAYDYVVSEALGVHVDFDESLGQTIEEAKSKNLGLPHITASRLDSVSEKCETAIKQMDRPIVETKTANRATIGFIGPGLRKSISTELNLFTWSHITETREEPETLEIPGFISSYNSNTYKGRFFSPMYGRPVPFEIFDKARTDRNVEAATESLSANALTVRRRTGEGRVMIKGRQLVGSTGTVKKLLVSSITPTQRN